MRRALCVAVVLTAGFGAIACAQAADQDPARPTVREPPDTTGSTIDESLAWVMANIIPWNDEATRYLAELTALPTFGPDAQMEAHGRRALCAEFGTRLDEWEASMARPPEELAGVSEYVFSQFREAVAACVSAPDDVAAAMTQGFSAAWGSLTGILGAVRPTGG